jgi:hypothetical protein
VTCFEILEGCCPGDVDVYSCIDEEVVVGYRCELDGFNVFPDSYATCQILWQDCEEYQTNQACVDGKASASPKRDLKR